MNCHAMIDPPHMCFLLYGFLHLVPAAVTLWPKYSIIDLRLEQYRMYSIIGIKNGLLLFLAPGRPVSATVRSHRCSQRYLDSCDIM